MPVKQTYIRHTFQTWKSELEAGRITPFEAVYRWTKVAIQETALNLKPYAELVTKYLPEVEWLKPGEHVIYGGDYLEWTCAADFYAWADRYMGHIFTIGQFLRDYIAEHEPAKRDRLIEHKQQEIAEKAKQAVDKPLAADPVAAGKAGPGRGNKTVGNDKRFTGNQDMTYTLRRLARDNPDLLELVAKGNLSPNAAAVQAGFRKPTRSIPIDTPEAAVKALLRVFTREQLKQAFEAQKGEVSA